MCQILYHVAIYQGYGPVLYWLSKEVTLIMQILSNLAVFSETLSEWPTTFVLLGASVLHYNEWGEDVRDGPRDL